MSFVMVIYCNLRFYRKKLGVKLSDLSLGCGISPDTISSIERRHRLPNLFTAYAIYYELLSIHRLYECKWEFPSFMDMFPVHFA